MPYEELTPSIAKVRELFNEDVAKNKELYDNRDVEKVNNDDWFVTRFLLRQKEKIDPSFEMLKTTLRWKKDLGIPSMKETDFPREFFRIGGIIPYEKDLSGNVMVYLRFKMHKKLGVLDETFKQYIVYTLNKVDEQTDGRGMALVFDCQDTGISNVDMDVQWLLVSLLVKYYPKGLAYVLIYELPWILNAVMKIVMSWIPAEQRDMIKYINKKDITNYVALENLPDFMGGLCTREYGIVPKQCPTVEELAKQKGMNDKEVQGLMKILEPLNQCSKEIAETN